MESTRPAVTRTTTHTPVKRGFAGSPGVGAKVDVSGAVRRELRANYCALCSTHIGVETQSEPPRLSRTMAQMRAQPGSFGA